MMSYCYALILVTLFSLLNGIGTGIGPGAQVSVAGSIAFTLA